MCTADVVAGLVVTRFGQRCHGRHGYILDGRDFAGALGHLAFKIRALVAQEVGGGLGLPDHDMIRQVRHHDVEQNQVGGRGGLANPDCLLAIVRDLDLVVVFEQVRHQRKNVRRIVDHDDRGLVEKSSASISSSHGRRTWPQNASHQFNADWGHNDSRQSGALLELPVDQVSDCNGRAGARGSPESETVPVAFA